MSAGWRPTVHVAHNFADGNGVPTALQWEIELALPTKYGLRLVHAELAMDVTIPLSILRHTKISRRQCRLQNSSYWRRAQEGQCPERVMRQVHQPPSLLLLLVPNRHHLVLEFDVLHEDVAVNSQEHGEESLHCFKVTMGRETL